ncbi:hypothetical protein BDR22DRAFT_890852 [Usnea florida]
MRKVRLSLFLGPAILDLGGGDPFLSYGKIFRWLRNSTIEFVKTNRLINFRLIVQHLIKHAFESSNPVSGILHVAEIGAYRSARLLIDAPQNPRRASITFAGMRLEDAADLALLAFKAAVSLCESPLVGSFYPDRLSEVQAFCRQSLPLITMQKLYMRSSIPWLAIHEDKECW